MPSRHRRTIPILMRELSHPFPADRKSMAVKGFVSKPNTLGGSRDRPFESLSGNLISIDRSMPRLPVPISRCVHEIVCGGHRLSPLQHYTFPYAFLVLVS